MIHFASPISTTHADARNRILALKVMLRNLHKFNNAAMAKDLYQRRIATQEAILKQPNRFVFPTFIRLTIGENTYGISLAGLRCDIPSLARKYGTEVAYAGNALHYKNWLGSHWDL